MRSQGSARNLGKAGPLRFTLRLLIILGVLTWMGGCTRGFYRKCADREVNDILAEKDKYAAWKIEQMHVYPDPRARFADPTNPDHPPMPPDDEAAWKLSPHPQRPGHAGVGDYWGTAYLEIVKAWDVEARAALKASEEADQDATPGVALGAPNTQKDDRAIRQPVKTYFDEPLDAELRGYLLTLEQSVELGVINSRQYQDFREQLYLAALPVTRERFSFAYQWAALADFIRQWSGPESKDGFQNKWTANSSIGFSKLFSTGALLTLDFANTTVFNFASHGLTSGSTVNLDFVQPLLQGGGQAVTLEPLTQAERNLFYSIRAFARFRKQFATSVAIGNTLPNNLAVAAGAGTATNPISPLAALGIASTDVSGGFVAYLSTLYRECDMATDKKLVHDLKRALKILEGYQEGGMFSPLQVDQVRSTLLQAENTVLTDQQFVTNALDQFKLVLGLPANLPLILDDTPARPVTRQLDKYYEVIVDSDAALKLVEDQEKLAPEKVRPFLLQVFTKDRLGRGTEFQKKVAGSWAIWAKSTDDDLKARLTKLDQIRRKLLDLKTDLGLKNQTLSQEDATRLREAEFESDLGVMEQTLRRFEARPWEKFTREDLARQDRIKLYRLVAHMAEFVLVWARNERFDHVGQSWPALPTAKLCELDLTNANVDQAQEAAVQYALANRWDLMNARAHVVDQWRQLRVTANALMGAFNVGYHLQSQTPPDGTHPLAFSSAATSQQVSMNFQLPLNRLAERNAYRAALINYQQARRSLLALEDNIAVQVRFDVRQLQLFAANYRIQKQVIQSLYSQVESALEIIVAPADPDSLKASGTAGQANAAALTNQYLNTLSGLNGAQARMYLIWLSFQATRMQLFLDLERLYLDRRGVWTDEQDTAGTGDIVMPGETTRK